MSRNIILIGFMGTGKSCIGRLLAARLNYHFFDTDVLVERYTKLTIPAIFHKYGEKHFRQLEKEVVARMANKRRSVISTGGGVPLDSENMQRLAQHGVVISLSASADIILSRTLGRNNRPLLKQDKQAVLALMQKRSKFYKNADFIID